jgi:YbbR domain-containing protein
VIRRLLDDLSLIVLAIALAFTVWVVATNEQNPRVKATFPENIPIQVLNKAEGLVIFPDIVRSVKVVVQTPETNWSRLTADKFEAWIDLQGLTAGRHDVAIQVTCTDRAVKILEIQPPEVSVRLEEYKEKELDVQVKVMDNPHLAYIERTPVVTPSKAKVSGPASLVDQVSQLVAEVYLRAAKEPVEERVELSAQNEKGEVVGWVDLTPPEVVVRVPIEQRRGYKEVTVRPILEGQVASGYRISNVSVEPSNVIIFGSPLVIEEIPGYLETTPIDVSNAKADVVERVPLTLPQGVTVLDEQSVMVRIGVTAIESSLTVQRGFVILGLQPGLNATPSPEVVDVILSGPVPRLDTLKPGDVQVILDLHDLQLGTHKITPKVVVPEGLKVESILPDTIEVEITVSPTLTPMVTSEPTRTPEPTATPKPTEMLTPTPTPLPPTPTPVPSPKATPAIQAQCPHPGSRLTYPTVNAVLKGSVQILGSANVDGFDYYKFEFRPEGVSEWSFLQRFNEPVTEGLLGVWDTSPLPPGNYWFRLVVVKKDGNYLAPCQVPVIVQ